MISMVVSVGLRFKKNFNVIFVKEIWESVLVISDCFLIIKNIFSIGVIFVMKIVVRKVFFMNLYESNVIENFFFLLVGFVCLYIVWYFYDYEWLLELIFYGYVYYVGEDDKIYFWIFYLFLLLVY